jgi:acetyltransferase-like isoleucine patch superfamily enzyme
VRLGARCTIEHYVSFKYDGIYKKGPSIVIGDECFIGTGVEFNIREKITVGNHVLIASGCRFIDGNHGMERGDVPIGGQEGTSHPIVLEDDVWLGANVIILEGVSIGRGSIIGAGAVVTKSVPSYEVWGGVPARYIRSRTSSPTNSIDDPIR